MTLGEVLSKSSYRRRPTLERILKSRFTQLMAGLEARRWSTIEEARAELKVSRKSMFLIRSALRIANVMPWSREWESFTLDVPMRTPPQTVLFVRDASQRTGYRYTQQ